MDFTESEDVAYAEKLNKRIVTILYRPLSAEDGEKMPPALAKVQGLDFNQYGGEFSANFNELVRTLDTDRDYLRSHTKWSQRALEWQGGEDRLLPGVELAIATEGLQEAEKKQPPATELQREFIRAGVALRDRLRRREVRTTWYSATRSRLGHRRSPKPAPVILLNA